MNKQSPLSHPVFANWCPRSPALLSQPLPRTLASRHRQGREMNRESPCRGGARSLVWKEAVRPED